MLPVASPRSLAALLRDRRGVISLYYALILSMMTVLSVAALDLVRVHMARSRVTLAVDSAILGAGRSLGEDNWRQVGAAFFSANIASSMKIDAPITADNFTTVDSGIYGVTDVSMSVKANIPLLSGAFGNLASMEMLVKARATNRSQTAELVMVLDNTGSMLTNDNIGKLRNDAIQLVNILADDGKSTTLSNIRVGIVPYAASVNPGAETAAFITDKSPSTVFDPAGGLNWKGCLIEPDTLDAFNKPLALTDAPPKTANWRAYQAPAAVDNNYTPGKPSTVFDSADQGNNSTGPNIGCPTPITPMTTNVASLKTALNSMQAWSRGGTISDLGLVWGYRLLSPAAPFTQAVPFNSGVPKFLVMMTDGEAGYYKQESSTGRNNNNTDVASDYAGYGRIDQYGLLDSYGYDTSVSQDNATIVDPNLDLSGFKDPASVKAKTNAEKQTAKNAARTIIEKNIAKLCTDMKSKGVIVYTITFGNLSTATKNLYSGCAYDAKHYYNAPDSASLEKAFKSIGYAITELRLVE